MIWSYNLTAIDNGQCHAGLFALFSIIEVKNRSEARTIKSVRFVVQRLMIAYRCWNFGCL